MKKSLIRQEDIVFALKTSPKAHAICRAAIFGSYAKGIATVDSDVDLLVEFEPNQTPSLFTIITMEDELASLLGRKADLRTAQDLSRYFRHEVLTSARPLYVKS